MKVLTALTQSLKTDNEDGFGFGERQLWVVDGATPLKPRRIGGRSAAAWLRATVCARLADGPWLASGLDQTLARLIDQVAAEGRRLGLDAGPAFPTAAVALVRQQDDAVETCLLGDVQVMVRSSSGKLTGLIDPQFAGNEAAILAEVARRLSAGHDPAVVYREVYALLRARRQVRNTDRGSWVLGDAAEAARHAFLATVAAPPGSDLLVMTDGFARLVDPFAVVPDTTALLREVAAGGAADLLTTLRAVEAADPGCVRFPRFGVSDDATVVHARL